MKLFNQVKKIILEIDTDGESFFAELKNNPTFLAVYTDKKNVSKVCHSGFNTDLFGTLLVLLSSHSGLFEFFKLLVENIERYKIGDGMEGFNFTPVAVEYIEWKKNNLNQSKINEII